ncbi:MEDS domain-containing protein [Streptomyces atacamensis]|uniref:MEDS domain-containing protein n=1 Tax=Streptomyces atacamensis TaxID=531966 RepID=UPI00399CCF46
MSLTGVGPKPSPEWERHVCCAYAGERQWARSAAEFVREGLAAGRRVVYFADTAAPAAVVERLGRNGVDAVAAVERGGLVVRRAEDSYLRRPPFDPDRMARAWEQECATAIREGYAGLYAVGEMAWCARGVPGADRLLEYELRLNREVFARLPLTALCLYDRAVVPEGTTALLTAAHIRRLFPDGRSGARTEPPLGVTPLADRTGFGLRGGADADTRAVLETALAALARLPGPMVHLDLSGADFLDTAAVAALAAAAGAERGRGRRLVLHRPPHSLRRVAAMFPEECGGLEIAP